MKKTFVANESLTINTVRGKMQFNTATPEFRSAMQYRYDAECKIADLRSQCTSDIKTINAMIDFTKKQNYYSTTDIEKYEKQIEDLRKTLSDAEKEIREKAPAITEADENLFLAYRDYVNGEQNEYQSQYVRAFYEWATINGLNPSEETFKFIAKKIGMKKMSAKGIIKSNGESFTTNLSKSAFLGMFYAVILEILKSQNLLRSFTFTCDFANELVKKAEAKKAAAEAKKNTAK